MKISAKIDYACRALIELSLHWPSRNPLQIHAIAERQEIPIKFLTHILIHLKQSGFVNSIRGKSGGYTLARHPREILLSDVLINFDGMGLNHAAEEAGHRSGVMDEIWQETDELIVNRLKQIHFEEIARRYRVAHEALTFEI